MKQPLVSEEKEVFVVWTNSDLTEGRGREYPIAVCIARSTAERIASHSGVMGSDGSITLDKIYKIGSRWYGLVDVQFPNPEETKAEERRIARDKVLEKVLASGISADEVKLLIS